MKVYSIGREHGCDIEIDDNSDVISRRHATLTVSSTGKMTIMDLSQNGTYVNGMKINSNVEVPVTRQDNISFAHVYNLDWKLIPDPRTVIIRYILYALLAVALIIGGIYGYKSYGGGDTPKPQPTEAIVDSLSNETPAIADSINGKKINDSVANDSVKAQESKPKKKTVSKKKVSKDDSAKKEEPAKDGGTRKKRFH